LAGNLRDRLQRIQLVKHNNTPVQNREQVVLEGWSNAGYMTLRREISGDTFIALPKVIPESAFIVIPGINSRTLYEDLLFFDLETTGLSGGAGTIAFLAAFGRLIFMDSTEQTTRYKLCITQYLLLDYPGESGFINALLEEFRGGNCTIVSYNGKCFDSQILKTRCLMNGLIPPEYRHADLLFPARRLWKRLLPDCSQATIETAVLSIDRTGDIPGSMAPDIWFSFLKNGDAAPLLGICEHNRRDISGLASIFQIMTNIAHNPAAALDAVYFDIETLSLRWHEITRRKKQHLPDSAHDTETDMRLWETGCKLLRLAAENGVPLGGHRAALQYAFVLLKTGKYDEGRDRLFRLVHHISPLVQVASLRALAIDSERRLRNAAEALKLTVHALGLLPPDSSLRNEFEHRKERLIKKLENKK